MTLAEALTPRRRRRRRAPPQNDTARICWLMEEATAAAFAVPLMSCAPPHGARRTPPSRGKAPCISPHVVLGLRYSEIGRLFRRDRTTAAHACQLVEDRRDNPAIDWMLQTLEQLCGDLARGILSRPQVRP
jgi:hypothetical protein